MSGRGPGEVTERDRRLLAALAITRFATVDHLASAERLSRAMAYRRLRVLRGHGLVAGRRHHVNDTYWFALTTRGAVLVEEDAAGVVPSAPRSVPRQPEHHRAVVATWAAFAGACGHGDGWRLAESHFASIAVGVKGLARPDLVLVLERPTRRLAVLIEVDCGTISARRMAQRTYLYAGHFALGRPVLDADGELLLLVAPTAKRRNRLFVALLDAPALPLHYGLLDEVTPGAVLTEPIWGREAIDDGGTARLERGNPFLGGSREGFTP